MKRILLFVLILNISVFANFQENPSFYQAANPNPKALNGYRSSSSLSGMSIFGSFQETTEKPYGVNLFTNGLSLGYIKEDYSNFYTVGYGISLGNHILSTKYSTDFSAGNRDHLDVGLMLAYRYLNLGMNVYNVNTTRESLANSEKVAGVTGFMFDRALFLSTYTSYISFDIENLDLTNSIGYKFSRTLMLEGYLKYNTSNFEATKNIGIEASAGLTPGSRIDMNVEITDEFNDGYSSKGAFVLFNEEEPAKTSMVKKFVIVNFPSKFVKKENMFNENLTYHKFYEKLSIAATSPSVKGIIVQLPTSIREGLGVIENFRTLLESFKTNGKEVHVYLESGGTKEFFLASVADSVYLNPSSYNIMKNPYLETIYYKGLLDKLGVKFEYIRFANYKSAIEPYAFDSMSTFARANKKELIDDMIKNLSNKKINFNELTKKVMITPKEMIDSGYVDDTLYWDQVVAKIAKRAMVTSLAKIDYRTDVDFSGGKIAIVDFKGAIIPGNSVNSIWGSSYVGSRSFTRLMNSLEKNRSVKGIIIRINSPGGSAVASDIIYHSIKKIKKPVYAYIESVGASGGYYTACGTNKIYASPSAIVGSIGIYAGKIDANGLFNKLGLKNEKVMSGPRDDMFSVTKTWEDDDYKILNGHLRYYYDRFLTVVAQNRKVSLDSAEVLGGGKIYSGTRAQNLGLVDEISDLGKVIKDMKAKVGGLNVGVSFVTTTSLSGKLMNSFVPSLNIKESVGLVESLQDEQIYMIEPHLNMD